MDSDQSDEYWEPFSAREEFKDLQPLPQDDGPDPVVKIAYNKQCNSVSSQLIHDFHLTSLDFSVSETYDYFRAIYASGEVSERALLVTQEAAELNPANYTVWHHRRKLLKALNVNYN